MQASLQIERRHHEIIQLAKGNFKIKNFRLAIRNFVSAGSNEIAFGDALEFSRGSPNLIETAREKS